MLARLALGCGPLQGVHAGSHQATARQLGEPPPPSLAAGWCHSPRGVSYCFGLAAAREFMAATGVRSIVRAHMMQAEGYEVLGHNEVVTVFSAVNYRGSGEGPGRGWGWGWGGVGWGGCALCEKAGRPWAGWESAEVEARQEGPWCCRVCELGGCTPGLCGPLWALPAVAPCLPSDSQCTRHPCALLRPAGNKGAVLVMDADLNMHFHTFDPPPSSPVAAAAGEAAADGADAAEQPQPEAAAASTSVVEAAAAAAAAEVPPLARASPPSSGPHGSSLLRQTSAELVAREEVQEDSLAVRHQLPAAAPLRAGSGRLAPAAAVAAASAPAAPAAAAAGLAVGGAKEDGPRGQEWRYALPPPAAAGVASVGRTASAT